METAISLGILLWINTKSICKALLLHIAAKYISIITQTMYPCYFRMYARMNGETQSI